MTPTMLRAELEPLPERMRHLPIDRRGYVVPWFVPFVNGEPEFRCMDGKKFRDAVQYDLCWICGGVLGGHLTFVTGPMCLISGTNGEPPSHWSCATWSARNCPFLSKPQMVRRENDMPEGFEPGAGTPIARNPGAVAIATMRNYKIFYDANRKPLIRMGLGGMEHVEWFFHGQPATRAQVQHSVDTGLPILLGCAEQDGPEALAELAKCVARFQQWLPVE